jgi:hypothetical protein
MASTGVDRVEGVDPSVAIKAPCVVATTGNITLSGAQTIDGVAVAETSNPTRVLVRAQTDSTENGVYDVKGASWTRSEDFNGNRDAVKGTLISIQSGTQYAGATFKVTTDDPIVIGTSNITFATANATDVITVVGTSGVDTYAKMRGLTSSFYSDGDVIKCTGDGIFGDFKIKTGAVTDNKGTKIVFNDDSNRYAERDFSGPALTSWFGSGPGIGDNYQAFSDALAAHDHVKVPTSNYVTIGSPAYYISDTIDLGFKKIFEIENKTLIKISSTLTSNDVPAFFMRGSFSQLYGAGRENCFIVTDNKCPNGVVKLGQPDMSTTSGNVEKCVLRDLTIGGRQLYGQTSGSPDCAVCLMAPELSGTFSYYHILKDLDVRDANIGIWYRGWANGIFARGLYGVHLGNTSLSPACFIYMNGGLDNMITDIFFNQSNDSTGIISETLDNTSNGSAVPMVPTYNSFRGIVCEQGGAATYAIDHINGSRCFYEIRDNTSLGFRVSSTFYNPDKNQLITTQSANFADLRANQSFVTGSSFFGTSKTAIDISVDGTQIIESGNSGITADGANCLLLNRKTSDGDILDFRKDGSSSGKIGSAAGDLYIQSNSDGVRLSGDSNEFFPCNATGAVNDNTIKWGIASSRWSEIFAGNGTINTSDEREKTNWESISEAEKSAALEIKSKIQKYKWIEAVNSKGDSARWHVGVGAQEVGRIMSSHGLNPDSFGFFCYDSWVGDDSLGVEAGYRYGLRYDQLVMFILAAL